MPANRKRFTGTAWYNRGDWDEIKRVIIDAHKLPEQYDIWRQSEEDNIASLEENGFTVQKIIIDPEEFKTWCQFRGQSPTMTAVLLFVAERIRPTPDARRVDGRRRGGQGASQDDPVDSSGTNSETNVDDKSGPAAPPQLSARERVALMRPDLAMLFPTPA